MAKTIQSLERGLHILNIIGNSEKPLLLNEIAEHFPIDRSSVFRLISTLVQNDYVAQDPVTKSYSLGYRVVELSGVFSRFSHIESLIRPVMQQVIDSTGQNTHLALLDGDEVVFLAVEQPRDHLSLNISVGIREPALVTALGRSLLAFSDPKDRAALIKGAQFKPYTDKSILSSQALETALEKTRQDFLAVDDEEYRSGIVCIAAPVFNHNGQARYSIGISGLKALIDPCAKEFENVVRQAGKTASERLGYRPTL